MNIKNISLVVIVIAIAASLLMTFYSSHDTGHGHSHGPEIQGIGQADKANSTTHKTIN